MPLITPTPEELRAAYDAITAEGPMAESTINLGVALRATLVRELVKRILDAAESGAIQMPLEGVITGAVLWGMNMGIRIGERRCRD